MRSNARELISTFHHTGDSDCAQVTWGSQASIAESATINGMPTRARAKHLFPYKHRENFHPGNTSEKVGSLASNLAVSSNYKILDNGPVYNAYGAEEAIAIEVS